VEPEPKFQALASQNCTGSGTTALSNTQRFKHDATINPTAAPSNSTPFIVQDQEPQAHHE